MAKKQKRAGKGRGTRGARAFDILALRRKLGAKIGQKLASRGVIARLIDAAYGSIVNWERGKAPSPRYVKALKDVEARLADGTLHVEAPRRGGRRPRGSGAAQAAAIAGAIAPVYANVLAVTKGDRDARVRFGLLSPGERVAHAVTDVVVPLAVLEQLRAGR